MKVKPKKIYPPQMACEQKLRRCKNLIFCEAWGENKCLYMQIRESQIHPFVCSEVCEGYEPVDANSPKMRHCRICEEIARNIAEEEDV